MCVFHSAATDGMLSLSLSVHAVAKNEDSPFFPHRIPVPSISFAILFYDDAKKNTYSYGRDAKSADRCALKLQPENF